MIRAVSHHVACKPRVPAANYHQEMQGDASIIPFSHILFPSPFLPSVPYSPLFSSLSSFSPLFSLFFSFSYLLFSILSSLFPSLHFFPFLFLTTNFSYHFLTTDSSPLISLAPFLSYETAPLKPASVVGSG